MIAVLTAREVRASTPCTQTYAAGSIVLEAPDRVSFFDSRDGLVWRRAVAPFNEPGEEIARDSRALAADDHVYTHASSNIAVIQSASGAWELSAQARSAIDLFPDAQTQIHSAAFSSLTGRWRVLASRYPTRGPRQLFERDADGSWTGHGIPFEYDRCDSLLVTSSDETYCFSQAPSQWLFRVTATTIDQFEVPFVDSTDFFWLAPPSEGANGALVMFGFEQRYDGDRAISRMHRFVLDGVTWIAETPPLPETPLLSVAATSSDAVLFLQQSSPSFLAIYYEHGAKGWTLSPLGGDGIYTGSIRSAFVASSAGAPPTVSVFDPTNAAIFTPAQDGFERRDFALGVRTGQFGACGCQGTGAPAWLVLLLLALVHRQLLSKIRRRAWSGVSAQESSTAAYVSEVSSG